MPPGAESIAASSPRVVACKARPPLVAHVIYRLDVGGLENGLVNLINRIPEDRFRHAVVCLTDYTEFRNRIRRPDVEVIALHKPPGHGLAMYGRLRRLFREIRPDIVHTRNLAALEAQVPAWLAGVPVRVHGEHGRDMSDLDGSSRKMQWIRRLYRPFVHRYIALSRDLESYLAERVGVPAERITHICNGTDTERFHPAPGAREPLPVPAFAGPGHFVVGTVGRMQAVKDQVTLARAFALLMRQLPGAAERLRLVMIGEGPLREASLQVLREAGVEQYAWLPGNRDDVPAILRGLDLFVLPSLAEGICNTILEALASGLPVVATAVGGNPELVDEGSTGTLVPAADPAAMAGAIRKYADNPFLTRRQGTAARATAEQRFSLSAMVTNYMNVYQQLLDARGR